MSLLTTFLGIDIIPSVITMTVPLLLGSIGCLLSEKSGVLNIGIEGMMLCSAFTSAVASYYFNNVWIGLIGGILTGISLGFLLALISVTLKGNQTLAGLAINMFSSGITGFMLQIIFKHGGNTPPVPRLPTFSFEKGIFYYFLNGQNVITVFSFLIPFILWFFIKKSKFGNWIIAVGEDPLVAETAGINVTTVRYLATILSGAFAGLAGVFLSLGQTGMFIENMSAGRGFIALAVLILGKWDPLLTLFSSIFVGYALAIQMKLQVSGLLSIPRDFYLMFPYLLTIILLLLPVGSFEGPSSVGKPYIKERK